MRCKGAPQIALRNRPERRSKSDEAAHTHASLSNIEMPFGGRPFQDGQNMQDKRLHIETQGRADGGRGGRTDDKINKVDTFGCDNPPRALPQGPTLVQVVPAGC